MSRPVAFFVGVLGICLGPLAAVYYRWPPFGSLPGGRLAQTSVVLGVGAVVVGALQAAMAVQRRPSAQERLSTPGQVAEARARVQADSRKRVLREIQRRELDAAELVNPTWSGSAPPAAAPTVDGVADLLVTAPGTKLLVSGRPGIGKSSFALLVAGQVLARPGYLGPVPVVMNLTGWNWDHMPLTDWLIERVEQDCNLGNRRAFGHTAAERLVVEGAVLPVLDGLDELPKPAQLKVIEYVRWLPANHSVVITSSTSSLPVKPPDTPLDLTCLVLRPLPTSAALDYLQRRDPRWAAVRERARHSTVSHLLPELQTPLMVSLALAVAKHDNGPDRLLSAKDRDCLRQTLLDRYVVSAFETNQRLSDLSEAERRHERTRAAAAWPPERADNWLRFLAAHATAERQGDIAWWRLWMTQDAGRAYAIAATVLVPALTAVATVMFGTSQPLLVALIGTSMTLGTRQTMAMPMFDRTLDAPLHEHPSLDLGFGVAVLVGVLTAATVNQSTEQIPLAFLAGALAAGLTNGASRLARPKRRAGVIALSGDRLRRRLRATAILGAVAYAAAVTLVAVLLLRSVGWTWAYPLIPAAALGASFVALRMSAWGTYIGIRATAAARRQLPWRLDRFLADCATIGVLRQAGQAYQFRHEAVRARLATHRPGATPATATGALGKGTS